jgi:hypothetical protein
MWLVAYMLLTAGAFLLLALGYIIWLHIPPKKPKPAPTSG